MIHDLERAWEELERAEHTREVALRQELLRQERLEQLNYKFEKKVGNIINFFYTYNSFSVVPTFNYWFSIFQSVLREGYLKEMIQVLSDPRYGSNLSQVDATVKKHEAIKVDIMTRVSNVTC